jgi:peptidoglycan hydrolase CwlO-like protein
MKKILSGITAMVLMLGLFTTGVQAAETVYEEKLSYEQIVQMMEQTNQEIYNEINKADDKADALVLSYEAADISQEQLNSEVDKIVEELIKVTSKKAEKLIEVAGANGYVIEAVWIEVEIGGRTVLVDPLITDGP